MEKRLLSHDPLTGLYTYHSYDPQNDTTIISYAADSTPVLDANQKIANDEDISKKGIKDGFWYYASIPVELQIQWLINEGLDVYKDEHWPRVLAKINDRDFCKVKTTHGYHAGRKEK